jgi:hypothetical protein
MIQASVNGDKDLEVAWNTLYNVLELNRLSFDPEDVDRLIRHSLITILDKCHHQSDSWLSTVDYLTRNEVFLFLAERTAPKRAKTELATCKLLVAFFTYLVEGLPTKGLLNGEVVDAVQIAISNDREGLIVF